MYLSIRQLVPWIATLSFLSASPVFAIGDSGGGACSPIDPTLARAAKDDSAEALAALVEYKLDERLEGLYKTDLDDIRRQGIAEWRRTTKVNILIHPSPGACSDFVFLWYAVNYGNISATKFLLSLGADAMTWSRSSYNNYRSLFPNYFLDCGRWAGRPKELKSEFRAEYLSRIRATYRLLAAQAERSDGPARLREVLLLATNEPSCQREDGFYKELMLELIDKSSRRELGP
ncbi:MAG: hypothetical protein ABIK82_07865 [Pseudomonadota bacterium]